MILIKEVTFRGTKEEWQNKRILCLAQKPGQGTLILTLYNSTEADFADFEGGRNGKPGEFADTPVTITVDGCRMTLPAGIQITLKPGQSITLMPGQYHKWQGIPGTGPVMLFEVSACNDDNIDNRFHTARKRIPEIEEDETPRHLIFDNYNKYSVLHLL